MVLNGHVSTEDVAKRAGLIGEAYTKNVVNVLTLGPTGAQEVLLQVKFAEVDRSAVNQWESMFSHRRRQCVGNSTTGQFGTQPTGLATNPTVSDLLNLFLYSPEIKLGATPSFGIEKSAAILAEPNLIAVTARKQFSSGRRVPFPVVQPTNGTNAVSVSFNLWRPTEITPVITPSGLIHLHVAPEVSTLDFSNKHNYKRTYNSASAPEKADTEFELQADRAS